MKKRIAVIGLKGLPAFGGGAAAMEGVLEQLKDEYDLTIFAVNSHTTVSGDYKGLRQIVFKSIKHPALNFFLYYFKSLLYVHFKEKYDLIHIHHLAGAYIVPLLRLRYKNIIATSHGMPDKTDKWKAVAWIYYPLMRFFFARFSSTLTSVTDLHAIYFEKYTNKKVVHIPNGINANPEVDSTKEELEKYIVFAAGRIIEIKGLHLLIKAMKKSDLPYKLLVIGDLNQNKSYKNYIEELSKELEIKFIPLIKEKKRLFKYISDSELFIFPSIIEAMSSMLLEVAALDVPIIASDIAENIDVFDDDEVLFFKSEDSQSLSEMLKYAIENRELMNKKAKKALSKVRSKYSFEKVSEMYNDLYLKELKR